MSDVTNDRRRALKCAKINSGGTTTNYATQFEVGFNPGKGTNIYRTLLEFDISEIPAGATIDSAFLQLNCTTAAGDALACSVHRVIRKDWVEDEVTWTIYKTGNNWTTAGCSGDGTDYSSSDPTAVAFNMPTATGSFQITGLASFIQDALDDESGTVEMRLKEDDESAQGSFICDGPTGSYDDIPRLFVSWSNPSGQYWTKIDATDDAGIRATSPTTNYGANVYGIVGTHISLSPALRHLEYYPLSSISGGTVLAGSYYVYELQGNPASASEGVTIYRVERSDWVEAEVTWNIYKTGSNWTTAGCDNDPNDYDADDPTPLTYTVTNNAHTRGPSVVTTNVVAFLQDGLDNFGSECNMIHRWDDEAAGTTDYHWPSTSEATDVGGNAIGPYFVVKYTPGAAARRIFIC